MTAKTIPLGELVEIIGGGTPSRERPEFYCGPIPWVTVKDLGDEFHIHDSQEHISKTGLDSSASNLIPAGNVIVSTRMAVGRAVMNRCDMAINQDLKALKCAESLLPDYLLYFLNRMSPKLQALASGATVKGITTDDLRELEIPLPKLSDQKCIAAMLSGADRLRRVRRHALELSDTFLPAAFLKIFGDSNQSAKRWGVEELENFGELDRGRSRHRPRNASYLYGGPYPFIQTGDVTNANLYIRKHSQTYSEEGLKQSRLWPTGTLCITIAANIAETAILTYPACFPDSIVGFTPGKRVRVEYIQFWLRFQQEMLERTAPESAQKNINLEILRELHCPAPPLAEQNKFAALVAGHERLRARQHESHRQSEHLFNSLLHKTFPLNHAHI